MKRSTKKIPAGVMHEPRAMAWAQLTPTSEHKEREGVNPVTVIGPEGTNANPLPVSKATTLLRRAYPYVFNCAAYTLTQCPGKIKETEIYKCFDMPAHVFYEYCLDDCTEQKDFLQKEIYEMLTDGKSTVKYIKVSEERTVLARPVIIAFSHTDLKTGKDKRIKNIKRNRKVDMVHIQILKELMTLEDGWLNVPKAFYAKTRRIYNTMIKNVQPIINNKGNYRGLVNAVKSMAIEPINTPEAARIGSTILAQINTLSKIEQGDFHKIYLALEYILVNRPRMAKSKPYKLLELCEKCAPEYVQEVDGKLYYKDKAAAFRFGLFLQKWLEMYQPGDRSIIGIERITLADSGDSIGVVFGGYGKSGL
jgi:hypothetical protein